MSSKPAKDAKGKSGHKKLALRKETIKDLTTRNAPVKGGACTVTSMAYSTNPNLCD